MAIRKKYLCDRCSFVIKGKAKRQRGLRVCDECHDENTVRPRYPKWELPRPSSDTVVPVSIPVVFTIGEAGILSLGNSSVSGDVGNDYVMRVVGDDSPGPDLQTIVSMPSGMTVTLIGTDNDKYLTVVEDDNIELSGGVRFLLSDGAVLSLVSTGSGWRETSRGETMAF